MEDLLKVKWIEDKVNEIVDEIERMRKDTGMM